jgi:HSP20 family protein
VRRDPADLALKQIEKLIGRDPLIRDILNPSLPAPRAPGTFRPAVDVWETEDGWRVVMDVPGVDKADLRVRLEGHRLVVTGRRAGEGLPGRGQVQEREAGAFRREFLLPFQVRGDAIAADLDAGVLRIELPRSGPQAERDIVVTEGKRPPLGPREVAPEGDE